jgi:hypothetical protein
VTAGVRAADAEASAADLDLEARMRDLGKIVEETNAVGMYVDRDTGEVVVLVPPTGSSFKPSLADPRLSVRVRESVLDTATVAAIKDEVSELAASDGEHSYEASLDARHDTVTVVTNAPRDRIAAVEDRYRGLVTYQEGTPHLSTRYADYQPHWGGAVMWVYDIGHPTEECTSGFSVLNAHGYDRMISAGHCGAVNAIADSPGGDTFGQVVKRNNFPDDDFESIGDNTFPVAPKIYMTNSQTSGNATAKVMSAQDPVTGLDSYCFSGIYGYVTCGMEFVDLDMNFCDIVGYPGDHCNLHTAKYCGPENFYGDSGSPVFIYQSTIDPIRVQIRGIILGYNPDIDCGYVELYSQISSKLDVTVKVASS